MLNRMNGMASFNIMLLAIASVQGRLKLVRDTELRLNNFKDFYIHGPELILYSGKGKPCLHLLVQKTRHRLKNLHDQQHETIFKFFFLVFEVLLFTSIISNYFPPDTLGLSTFLF